MNTKSIFDNLKECVTTKYTQFTGRAGRAEFWQFWLVCFVINAAISTPTLFTDGTTNTIFIALYYIFNLAILLPTLAVGVRRMHDIGKGGGWLFINLIPLAGAIWFIVLAAQKSEPAPNRFG